MSDEIEDLFAQLRKAMQRRETDAFKHGKADTSGEVYRQGFSDGQKALRDRILVTVTAIDPRENSAAPPPALEVPAEAPDATFLRQALGERAAEPAPSPEYEENSSTSGAPDADDKTLETKEGEQVAVDGGLISGPAAETGPTDPAPPAPLGTLADVIMTTDRPKGAQAYWPGERDEILRGLIAGKPTMQELLDAFPESNTAGIMARCYTIKIDPPTKTNLERWAIERGRVNQADAGKVSFEDVINCLRITGDVVLTLDDPLCELFSINGKKVGRADLLATANKYRRRAGKEPWEAGQIVWKRQQLPEAPAAGNPAKALARQAAK